MRLVSLENQEVIRNSQRSYGTRDGSSEPASCRRGTGQVLDQETDSGCSPALNDQSDELQQNSHRTDPIPSSVPVLPHGSLWLVESHVKSGKDLGEFIINIEQKFNITHQTQKHKEQKVLRRTTRVITHKKALRVFNTTDVDFLNHIFSTRMGKYWVVL